MLHVSFDTSNLTATIEGLSRRVTDLSGVWPTVHRIFLVAMREQFKSEGRYASGGWKPLNPAYAEYKKRTYGPKKILEISGRLGQSFFDANHPDHLYRTGPSFMEAGSRTIYAKAHHFGYMPRNLPARPIIRLTRAEGENIADAILAFILKGVR